MTQLLISLYVDNKVHALKGATIEVAAGELVAIGRQSWNTVLPVLYFVESLEGGSYKT